MAGAENQNKSSGGYIIDAHKIEIGELVDRYTTNLEEGLRDEDVIILREQYGFNELTPTKGKP